MPKPNEPSKRLTPELASEIEARLAELSRLKARRAELVATIDESNAFLNDTEKRLTKVWAELDQILDDTL